MINLPQGRTAKQKSDKSAKHTETINQDLHLHLDMDTFTLT